MHSDGNEVVTDLSPVIRVYKDGRVERIFRSPHVPPSPEDSATGVSSKDLNISSDLKARIYVPKLSTVTADNEKLPILVYYHEYRLAPEHPLSAIYDDSWTALQWVGSHVLVNPKFEKEEWLIEHGDFEKNLRRRRQCRR
ncbi:hypothetical protein HAX54_043899 [Datura stramonium]|uniref:Alpha/beta hydrolase fold-3 domain-containing protein n=1 Tax=Datura stramonium TaxID=4076 RepID=A0ABS8W1R4_DATST|nr:hypothetical protein [Datura stramonium]